VYHVTTTYDLECDAPDCDNHVGNHVDHIGLARTYEGPGAPENAPTLKLDLNYVELTAGFFVVVPPTDGAPEDRAHRHFCSPDCITHYYDPATRRARGGEGA
jgi:hypothetical protein